MPDPVGILQINDGNPVNLTVSEPESFTFDMVIAGAGTSYYMYVGNLTIIEA